MDARAVSTPIPVRTPALEVQTAKSRLFLQRPLWHLPWVCAPARVGLEEQCRVWMF